MLDVREMPELIDIVTRIETLENLKTEYEKLKNSSSQSKIEMLEELLNHFDLTQDYKNYVLGCPLLKEQKNKHSIEEQKNKYTIITSEQAKKILLNLKNARGEENDNDTDNL